MLLVWATHQLVLTGPLGGTFPRLRSVPGNPAQSRVLPQGQQGVNPQGTVWFSGEELTAARPTCSLQQAVQGGQEAVVYTACNRLKKSDSWIGGFSSCLRLYQGGTDWSQILPGVASTLSWLPVPPMWS